MKAGLLGHKLSMVVGDALFDLFKAADIDAIVTESSICKIQLAKAPAWRCFIRCSCFRGDKENLY